MGIKRKFVVGFMVASFAAAVPPGEVLAAKVSAEQLVRKFEAEFDQSPLSRDVQLLSADSRTAVDAFRQLAKELIMLPGVTFPRSKGQPAGNRAAGWSIQGKISTNGPSGEFEIRLGQTTLGKGARPTHALATIVLPGQHTATFRFNPQQLGANKDINGGPAFIHEVALGGANRQTAGKSFERLLKPKILRHVDAVMPPKPLYYGKYQVMETLHNGQRRRTGPWTQ